MTPKGRNAISRAETSTESYNPSKTNTAASVSSRRGDFSSFSPTVRSRQRADSRTRDFIQIISKSVSSNQGIALNFHYHTNGDCRLNA